MIGGGMGDLWAVKEAQRIHKADKPLCSADSRDADLIVTKVEEGIRLP
jgi:hypothetical protein